MYLKSTLRSGKKTFFCLELFGEWLYYIGDKFEVYVFHILHKTISPSHLRLSLLAWMLVFVCGQTLAANHLHLDSHASDEVCAVCIHAQDHSIIDNDSIRLAVAASHYNESNLYPSLPQASAPSAYLSRAPPQA